MKKPLILLVDDELRVLEALETALTPVFEDICLVEAFEDPRHVLEEIPTWIEEKRTVALAIVDQKMPHLMGVELLSRLRELGPTKDMQAILLTGQAGLDSALEAKNRANVQRYMEKPWVLQALLDTGKELIARYFQETKLHYFLVEDVGDPDTLLRYLKLRHAIYSLAPHLANFLGPGPYDTDPYDRLAWFLSLHHYGVRGEPELVGGLRIVTDRVQPSAEALAPALAEAETPEQDPEAPTYPVLKLFEDDPVLLALIEEFKAQGLTVAEPSRLIVSPKHRAVYAGRLLIQSTVASYVVNKVMDVAVITCHPKHRRFYKPLGYETVPDTPELGDPVPAVALCGPVAKIPPKTRDLVVDVLGKRLKAEGGVCFCKTYPKCVPGPYHSGNFASSDLLCPIKAREMFAEDKEPSTEG